uniref:Uncharacterized protein n=1 Tax=Panagrolaimus sp. PS1159 TaxID=55785 RepID=A0AC35GIM3_9BILA
MSCDLQFLWFFWTTSLHIPRFFFNFLYMSNPNPFFCYRSHLSPFLFFRTSLSHLLLYNSFPLAFYFRTLKMKTCKRLISFFYIVMFRFSSISFGKH